MSASDQSSGFNLNITSSVHNYIDSLRLIYESQKGFCRIFFTVRNGRKLAYKALREEYKNDPIYSELLRKEYEIGHTLYHHGLVSFIGFETIDNLGKVIVMEFIDGVTLKEYLASHGPLNRQQAENILTQLTTALSYLHSHGLVHRDLKPANIMLTHSGQFVKIIDFGLSDGTAFTDYKTACGTHHYSAPEQLSEGTDNDPRVDIYSVGRIMLDLLPNAGGGWKIIADRCISTDPSHRPGSVEEILPAIHRADRHRQFVFKILATVLVLIIGVFCYISFIHTRVNTPNSSESLTHVPPRNEKTQPDTTQTIGESSGIDSLSTKQFDLFSMAEPPAVQKDEIETETETQTVSPTPEIEENDSDLTNANIPLEEVAYKKARDLAAVRWKSHIHAIDTMRTKRSAELAMVGHWRYLAKEDFKEWLATKISKGSPYFDQFVDMAYKTFRQYEEEHKLEQSQAWVRARKNHKMTGAITVYQRDIGNDYIRRDSLMEDGTWAIRQWHEPTRRALEQIRNESRRY